MCGMESISGIAKSILCIRVLNFFVLRHDKKKENPPEGRQETPKAYLIYEFVPAYNHSIVVFFFSITWSVGEKVA